MRPVRAVVAGAGAVAVALVPLRFGASAEALVAAVAIAALAALCVVDLEQRRLPNAIVLPTAAFVYVAQLAIAPERALEWTLAALGAAALLFVLHLVNPAGMGFGDVKLALLLGALLGKAVLPALVVASLAGGAYGAFLLLRHGSGARTRVFAYGPFLAFGAVAVLLTS